MESVVIAAITLISFLIGFDFNDASRASTFAFAVLGMIQVFHCLNCKFEGRIKIKDILNNKFMNMATLVAFFIVVFLVLTPAGALFGLQCLKFVDFIICLVLSLIIIPITELFKVLIEKI